MQIPEGYKLVPIEPTDAMQLAGAESVRFETTAINKIWTANKVYRAMVGVAPDDGLIIEARAKEATEQDRLNFAKYEPMFERGALVSRLRNRAAKQDREGDMHLMREAADLIERIG